MKMKEEHRKGATRTRITAKITATFRVCILAWISNTDYNEINNDFTFSACSLSFYTILLRACMS